MFEKPRFPSPEPSSAQGPSQAAENLELSPTRKAALERIEYWKGKEYDYKESHSDAVDDLARVIAGIKPAAIVGHFRDEDKALEQDLLDLAREKNLTIVKSEWDAWLVGQKENVDWILKADQVGGMDADVIKGVVLGYPFPEVIAYSESLKSIKLSEAEGNKTFEELQEERKNTFQYFKRELEDHLKEQPVGWPHSKELAQDTFERVERKYRELKASRDTSSPLWPD